MVQIHRRDGFWHKFRETTEHFIFKMTGPAGQVWRLESALRFIFTTWQNRKKKTLIQQQSGNFSWRPRAQIEQLAWPVAERQIGHRKSCLVLSARSTDVPVLLLNQPLITSQLQVLRNIVWIVTRLTTIERVVLHMTARINRRFCSLISNACLS